MDLSSRVGDKVLVDEKDNSYRNFSGKDGYITVCYLVSTCQNKMIWTLMVIVFNTKPEEGNGDLGDRIIAIAERGSKSPKDQEAIEYIF